MLSRAEQGQPARKSMRTAAEWSRWRMASAILWLWNPNFEAESAWLTGAPLLFSGPRSPRPPPIPFLPFDFPRPHQEGYASKLRLARVQIQKHSTAGVMPPSSQI